MLCVRCGSANHGGNHCGKCGAILPRNFGQPQTTSMMDLEDGRTYAPPDRSYPNNALDALERAVDAFYEGTGGADQIQVCADTLEQRLSDLLSCMPDTQMAIRAQKEDDPDDLPHHIGYLVQMGTQYFNDALEKLRQFLAGGDDSIDEVIEELRKGNDYICHSASLVGELFARDGQTVEIPETEDTSGGVG